MRPSWLLLVARVCGGRDSLRPAVGRVGRVALVALTLGLAGACDSGHKSLPLTGPTTSSAGIVVESMTIETLEGGFCEVRGQLRNNGTTDQEVTLVVRAFDRHGSRVGIAEPAPVVVPAGGRARYSTLFTNLSIEEGYTRSDFALLGSCERIDHVEIADLHARAA